MSSEQSQPEKNCGKLGDDDNVDPRAFFDRRQRGNRGSRKALQLCRQVQRALSYAMGETGDDMLLELYIEAVEPAPNEKRMMVTVSSMGQDNDPVETLSRLQFATPFLRGAVAAAINRKRVPELMFQCVPPQKE